MWQENLCCCGGYYSFTRRLHPYPIYKAFSSQSCIFSYIYTRISRLRNIGPPSRIHNTQQRKRIENKERSQLEAQYQREIEGVRNDVAHLTSLLEQMLRAKYGEGTSTQPDEAPPAAQISVAPINMGANTPYKQHPNPTRPIQIPITIDLTSKDPQDVRFSDHVGYDK
jgi:hypothetical protein